MTQQGEQEYEEQETRQGGGAMVRRETFDGMEVSRKSELAAAASQAGAMARVQARFVMAMKNRRDPDVVREDFLSRCADLEFANVAIYRRPQGKKKNEETGRWEDNIIEGPSIRFVEALLQCTPNMGVETPTVYDDDEKVVIRISVMDYERNTDVASEVTVFKTIERRELKKNQRPISTRTNSYGEPVYILPATDDDVRMKVARQVSMTIRQNALRLLPGGLVAEAKRKIYETLKGQDKGKDPAAVRRGVADKFAAMGISAAQIAEYFGGVNVSQLTDDQVLELRLIGAALTNGEGRWSEYLEGSPHRKDEDPTGEEGKATGKNAEIQARVKEQLDKRRKAAPPPTDGGGAPPAAPVTAPVTAPPARPPSDAGAGAGAGAGVEPLVVSIAGELGLDVAAVAGAVKLFRDGRQAHYIARYKKEQAGNLDEAQLKAIADKLAVAGATDPASIAKALGITLELVQAVLKLSASAGDAGTEDGIVAAAVDAGLALNPQQVMAILQRASGATS